MWGVTIENRVNAVSLYPVDRLIRVHAETLKTAAHIREASRCAEDVVCPPCNDRQCRIVINALLREIDRLRRGFDQIDCCNITSSADSASCTSMAAMNGNQHSRADQPSDCCETGVANASSRSSPHALPKSYAVTPLGYVRSSAASELPVPIAPAVIVTPPHVTNVGSLLDILA